MRAPIRDTVAANAVWVTDRNFCTTGFLFGIARWQGCFVIRRHAATLRWDRESAWEPAGRTDTGTLAERTIWLLGTGNSELPVRQVRLTRDRPASDGDGVIEILTHLPAGVASAAVVVERYRGRWTVESCSCD